MANILILGAGSMGTAFSFPCSDNNHQVAIVGTHLENDFIDQINSNNKHPVLNCDIPKNVKFFKFEKLSEEIKKKVDLIALAVSSKGIEWASDEISKVLKSKIPILILTKGLAINNNNYEILAHKVERILKTKGVKDINISAVGGPCLAPGLANRVHSGVVIANKNLDAAQSLSDILSTNYYHVSTSSDINGVEVCAAIKNIFSMVIGASSGLNKTKSKGNFHLNTSAALVKQSIFEMEVFVDFLKGKKETVKGLAGIGDLYVSASGGRNSRMGALIGEGMTFSKAKSNIMPDTTVEGAELIFEIGNKIKEDFNEKKLPLMIAMINAILDDKKLVIKWENFN